MILADSSVWIDHFHGRQKSLSPLLKNKQILIHPIVLGELALGQIKNRTQVLRDLALLPQAMIALDKEVLDLVERRNLFGKGLGWADAHLLASCLLSGAQLWTNDKTLLNAARACNAPFYS
jgi:predicted nucleic acid-binding protein